MKTRTFAYFILFYLLGQVIPAHAVDSIDTNANPPQTFENAEAWDIKVETILTIPRISSQPSFSRDFQKLLYVSGQPINDGGIAPIYDISLVVMSLETMEVVKTIKLTEQGGHSYLGRSLACSPDGNKVAYGPVGTGSPTNLLFIDLDTSKVIGVAMGAACNQAVDANVKLCWPNSGSLDVLADFNNPSYRINLDTLEVNSLSGPIIQTERDIFRMQTHKNCVLDFLSPWNEPRRLNASSRQHPYKQVLIQHLPENGGTVSVIWTPNLCFAVFQAGPLLWDGNMTASLVKLGLRPTPILDFEIKGLDQTLTTEQRQTLKDAFATGKRIWLSVYDSRINPLTDKVIGPDESNLRGQGFLTQIEPTFRFKYSYENLPAQTNNIVSTIQVDNGENWGTKVWGVLVESQDKDIAKKIEKTETAAQPNVIPIVSSEPTAVTTPAGTATTLLYPAVTGGRWGFVNKSGETVINPQFERAQPFSEGLAGVRTGGKWGFIGENGKFSINPQFDAVKNFVEGMAPVQLGRRWGFINPAGKFVINPQFDDAACFTNGVARVKLGAQFGYINPSGVFVNNPTH